MNITEVRAHSQQYKFQRTFDSVVGEMGLSETARVTLQVQFVDAGQYDGFIFSFCFHLETAYFLQRDPYMNRATHCRPCLICA